MEEKRQALKESFLKNKQNKIQFARIVQEKIAKESSNVLSSLLKEDEDFLKAVDTLITIVSDTTIDKLKPKKSWLNWFSLSPIEQFQELSSTIRLQLDILKRTQYKLTREHLVVSKKKEQLQQLAKELQIYVDIVEESINEYPEEMIILNKQKELKTSQFVLLQLEQQVEMTKQTIESSSKIISELITNTIPVWENTMILCLNQKNSIHSNEISDLKEKQTQLLNELKKFKN